MPAHIASTPIPECAKRATARGGHTLRIGLVNNMPDGAIKATERQFLTLLDAASGPLPVALHLLAIPDVPRSDIARRELMAGYGDPALLQPGDVDALIVTGAEPRAEALQDEAYWPALTRLIDWAKVHTVSSIFSCLAAHGAVLHLDGIHRRARAGKLSGVFACMPRAAHPLLANGPLNYNVPHSRWNGLATDELVAHGYTVLTQSDEAGADTFVREDESLLVFFQGHMEYDARSLLREYQRDAARFIAGERADYPDLPAGYLDCASQAAFAAVGAWARSGRDRTGLAAALATAGSAAQIANTWRAPATALYANWLDYILQKKVAATPLNGSKAAGHGCPAYCPV